MFRFRDRSECFKTLRKELNRPVMIQFSEGGAAFLAGKSLPNEKGKLQVGFGDLSLDDLLEDS